MKNPTFQAEIVITTFLEIDFSLHHSGICTVSLLHFPNYTPSTSPEGRRNLLSGNWNLLLLPLISRSRRRPGKWGWGVVFYPIWGRFLSNTVSRRITCYYDNITNVLHVPVYVIRVSHDITVVLCAYQETRCLIRAY